MRRKNIIKIFDIISNKNEINMNKIIAVASSDYDNYRLFICFILSSSYHNIDKLLPRLQLNKERKKTFTVYILPKNVSVCSRIRTLNIVI